MCGQGQALPAHLRGPNVLKPILFVIDQRGRMGEGGGGDPIREIARDKAGRGHRLIPQRTERMDVTARHSRGPRRHGPDDIAPL